MSGDGGAFPHVFAPLTLRHRTLRCRINLGAHTTNMAEDGLPSERHIGYYRERAIGGAGMIVVEPVPVHRTAVLTRGNFRPDDDSVIDLFRRLTDACHEAADGEVTMIQQLYHVGQHGDADNSFAPNWSPSGLPSLHDADGSHAVTEAEIDELIGAFTRAAVRAHRAGFDGVELFAAYHALIDQFWTPWSNRRTDRWGGSLENRVRFSSTLLDSVRRACGDDFVIGLAVNLDPTSDGSLSVAELQEIVAWHDERALMDYVTCGTGSYFDFGHLMPTSLYPQRLGEPFAAALKEVVTHAAVQAESHIRTPAAAEAVLAAGHADMVSIVRGQIADPHLVAKARRGRPEEVRPCISCNQLCWGRRSRDYWISCLVNPSVGRETPWGGDRFEPAPSSRRVLVVGGGPAGLETARVAAERGHDVTLHEATGRLGGQWRLAGRQPSRDQIGDHLAWYESELARLGVAVLLGSAVDVDGVVESAADDIVVATGAEPARRAFQRSLRLADRLPGLVDGRFAAVEDVLAGAASPSGTVLLVDDLGDWRGIGTAMLLQESGCDVTICTAAPVVAGGLFHSAADAPARRRFTRAGGRMEPHTTVTRWTDAGAELRSTLTGACELRPFDWLVAAETPIARSALSVSLDEAGVGHVAVGDCVAPRAPAWPSTKPAVPPSPSERPSPATIRDATVDDAASISAIYNATIPTTTAAWTEELEPTSTRRRWLEEQVEAGHVTLVAEVDRAIVGFAAFGDFRDTTKWPGYRFVVELSVHVTEAHRGAGIGRALLTELIERAREAGKTQIVAGIDGDNVASMRFHERLGFGEVARMPGVGFKFGRWLDLVLMQRSTAATAGPTATIVPPCG